MNSNEIKKFAKSCGADLVGIGAMDRWEGAPRDRDPRYIFPEARSCIVMGFRIPRGYLRGIEEGTCFAPYTALGYAGINEVYAPKVIRELCCFIEDYGYEAVPQPNIYLRPNLSWSDPSRPPISIPVSPDRPAPDILIDQRIAAYIAGLGEFGYSKVFLTPEFGPMQRFVTVLTDMELEPDPIFEGHICDRCMLCAKNCSGDAISRTETEKFIVAGHVVEFGKLDVIKCGEAYRGGNDKYNPFMVKGRDPERTISDQNGIGLYMRHNSALEGARGCIRACYVHLEESGRLTRKFRTKFRKRPQWTINRDKTQGESVPTENDETLF